MVDLGKRYIKLLEKEFAKLHVSWKGFATVPLISSVTGNETDAAFVFGPEYWRENLVSPVRFSTAVAKLLETRADGLFVEIGPHSALAGPLRQICTHASRPCEYISILTRGEGSCKTFSSALGKLFQLGVNIDLTSLYPGGKVLTELPTYAWDHSGSFWYESRISHAWRTRKYAHHALLGARVPESPDTAPQWRNVLYLEDEQWMADHRVKDDVVFPFAGYVAMAGEAVRQMTGVNAGYSMRHVVVRAAMVMTHEKGVELITALRRHALTDSDVSEWYEFSISGYNGATWTKHAEGQVKAIEQDRRSSLIREEFPRKVNISRFYGYMEEVGIAFGPEFRRLENVTSCTTEARASADISPPPSEQSRAYVMHPVTIDACFQLCLLSQAKGLGRNFDQLVMPTLIESLEIRQAGDKMTAIAFGGPGGRKPGIECASHGILALALSGLELTPLEEGDEFDHDPYAAAHLEWLPDFDFVDMAPLFKAPPTNRENLQLIEQLTLLCIIDSEDKIKSLEPAEPHFEKLQAFLGREIQSAKDSTNRLAPDSASYLDLSQADRKAMIEELYENLSGKARAGLTKGLKRINDNIVRIFTGQVDTIDILMEGGVLAELYNAMSFGYSDFVRLLSSTKPTLRILEVGAGTGGTTELILRDLMHEGGLPRYSTYTFTDVSAGFFPQAKERFSYAPNMDYKVFDISRDPLEQEFTEGTYDVIFAANVVHATASLKEALGNLNKVLRPGGALVLTEICTELRSPTYIFGNFIGWWLGEADGRPLVPYVPPSRWHDELLASGFTGVETAVYDEEAPYVCCTTIFSRRPVEEKPRNTAVSLLALERAGEVATSLKSALEQAKYDVNMVQMGETLPKDQDIVSAVDIERNFFDDINEPDFLQFRELIRNQGAGQKLLWLTSPVQIKCKDPRSAQALGAARTVRTELATPFYTLEISKDEPRFVELVLNVFNKIRAEEDEDNLLSDKEFVVDNGIICIGRYHPFSLTDEISRKSLEGRETITCLRVGKPGDIESLYWDEVASPTSIPTDEIEIEPKSLGLNLRDILIAVGVIPHGELGLDVAGLVTRVGPNVDEFKPGDRVFAFCPEGCFGTRAMLNRYHAAKIPDGLDFDGAASIPVVFATTIHSLINIVTLQRGQSVLIHAACGGVGLSAIQVCKMVGAEIFATCGSQDKIEYLVNEQSIARDHIFYSRDERFLEDVMAATDGRGVDVVINSLSGSLLHASWKCVAEFGTMLEIGKRDILGYGKLDLNPFLGNRRFVCFEGIEMARQRAVEIGRVLHQFNEYYEKGLLRPIQIKHYPSTDLVSAFRHLQHGSHIGKVVVNMTGAEAQLKAKPSAKPLEFDPEATYLLTGGLGGLGKSMSTWMIEHGARSLTFLSRSAGVSEDSRQAIRELESMGAEVLAVAGGVENIKDVESAVIASNRPIKGVFHLAMVLRDSPMVDMTWSQWDEVKRVKIDGAWNLHNSLKDHQLDFFWLASSIVTVIEQPGQGNYSAASTYIEAFAQYRRGLGLPASVLNICPVKGVGFVAENSHAMRNTKAQGIYFLGEREYLHFAEHAILSNKPDQNTLRKGPSTQPPLAWKDDGQVIMGLRSALHLEDPNNRCNWRRDRRMGSYHNIRTGQTDAAAGGDSGALKGLLRRASEEPDLLAENENIELLAHEIGVKVYDFMLKPGENVDTSLSLQQIGLDSLMATELRRWFRQLLGLQVSVLEIMATGSLTQLAELISTGLRNKYASAA
jgi:NADPH:quinone reductase-like Zn-dependent oxidoreductase/SAM-dependent methyltransferase/NAD(P)-dependent dehydrogenase (short-subunit alcohol dehydrogenase family)